MRLGLEMPISVQAAETELKVEVTMKDMAYVVKGWLMPGALTAIVVRTQDSVTHGFSSPVFKEAMVRKVVKLAVAEYLIARRDNSSAGRTMR